MAHKHFALQVTLSSVPNRDFNNRFEQQQKAIAPVYVVVANYAEASGVCRNFIADNDLGGGNWTGGQIRDEFGDLIGRVSYNGRVWGLDGDGILN